MESNHILLSKGEIKPMVLSILLLQRTRKKSPTHTTPGILGQLQAGWGPVSGTCLKAVGSGLGHGHRALFLQPPRACSLGLCAASISSPHSLQHITYRGIEAGCTELFVGSDSGGLVSRVGRGLPGGVAKGPLPWVPSREGLSRGDALSEGIRGLVCVCVCEGC